MKKAVVMILAVILLITAIPVCAAEITEYFTICGEYGTDLNEIIDASVQHGIGTGAPVDTLTAADPAVDIEVVPAMKGASKGFYDVSVTGTMVRSEIQEFVRLLNKERAAMGRPPVRLDQEMMGIAEMRAAEGSLFYNHIRPDGSSGSNWSEAAQLTATSDANAGYLLQRWKESAAHWNGITDTYSTRFGLGIYDQGTGVCSVYACLHQDKSGAALKPYMGTLNDTTETYSFIAGNQYIDFAIEDSFQIQAGTGIAIKPKYYIWFAYDPNYFGYFNNDNGTWVSDDPSVTAIDAQGNLVGIRGGTTIIHFYLNGDRSRSYDARVTVTGESLPVMLKGNYIYRGSERLYGWIQDAGDTYYSDPSTGIVQTGVVEIDGKEYFFVPVFSDEYEIGGTDQTFSICTMLKNVVLSINGQWYRFAADGTFSKVVGPEASEPEVTAPAAPELVAAVSGQMAKLKWNRPKGACGYQIYKYNAKTKKYGHFKTFTAGKSVSYNPKLGLAKTEIFKIRAYALKKDGKTRVYGKFSKAAKVKTAPAKPTIIKAISKKKGQVLLQWKKPAGAEGYRIYRATSKNGKYTGIKSVTKGTMLSYINSRLASGKTYYYKIRAYRTNGSTRVYSSLSNLSSVKTR